jgi:hypothetical protein
VPRCGVADKSVRAPLGGEGSGHFPVTAFFISQLSKDRAYALLSALGCWKLGGLGVKGRATHSGTGALRDTHPTGLGARTATMQAYVVHALA